MWASSFLNYEPPQHSFLNCFAYCQFSGVPDAELEFEKLHPAEAVWARCDCCINYSKSNIKLETWENTYSNFAMSIRSMECSISHLPIFLQIQRTRVDWNTWFVDCCSSYITIYPMFCPRSAQPIVSPQKPVWLKVCLLDFIQYLMGILRRISLIWPIVFSFLSFFFFFCSRRFAPTPEVWRVTFWRGDRWFGFR